jgi:hypothetical protein
MIFNSDSTVEKITAVVEAEPTISGRLLFSAGGAVQRLPLVETEHSTTTIIKNGSTAKSDVRQSLIEPFQDDSLACRLIRKRTGR